MINQEKTINQIKKDKFKVFHKINSFAGRKKSDEAMVYAMGKILCDLSRLFAKYKPDLVLTGFDIGANFALCVAGAHFNIPVLHIQGGEVSGSIDESISFKTSFISFCINFSSCESLLNCERSVVLLVERICLSTLS